MSAWHLGSIDQRVALSACIGSELPQPQPTRYMKFIQQIYILLLCVHKSIHETVTQF